MIHFPSRSRTLFVWLLSLAAALGCAQAAVPTETPAQNKTIHLRNETIDPTAPQHRATMAALLQTGAPASGLFLIQFTGPPDSARRAELQQAGVELIKYVPDDAYVAKFTKVVPAAIAAKGDVAWVGLYRPEHKVHPRLAAAVQGMTNLNETAAVNILLAPKATAAELASVRALLASVQSESHLRQGTFIRGELPARQLNTLTQSGAVLWVEPAPHHKLYDEAASKLVGGDDGQVGTPTLTEQLGFTGSNVLVCVADTGLDSGNTNTMHPDLHGRVTGFTFYPPLTDGSDGYGHGTHCAGIVVKQCRHRRDRPDIGAVLWPWGGVRREPVCGAHFLCERQ